MAVSDAKMRLAADAATAVAQRPVTWAHISEEIREALEGDSNDAEHDALAVVAEFFGIKYEIPDD